MSYFLTKAVAEKAVTLVMPSILRMMEDHEVPRAALHIVIIDPLAPASGDAATPAQGQILYEHSIGNQEGPDWAYGRFARKKAELAWRHRQDTLVTAAHQPHLMAGGDCKWPGGVYFEGLAVAASGVQGFFDEMFARWVAAACVALAKQAMEPILADDSRAML